MPSSLFESLRRKIALADPEELKRVTAQLMVLAQDKKRLDPLSFFEAQGYQEPIFRSKAKYKAVIGSNRIGKTTCGCVETVQIGTATSPYLDVPLSTTQWIISVNFKVQREALQPKFMEYLPAHKIAHRSYREHDVWDKIVLTCNRCDGKGRKTGEKHDQSAETWWCQNCNLPCSQMVFKSCDQDLATFQAVSLYRAWFDEEPPKPYFTETKTRLVDQNGILLLTMTPVKGIGWTYDEIFNSKDPDIEVFGGTMYDNKYLDRETVRKFEASLDPAEARIRVYGEYTIMEGLIFKVWDPEFNEVEKLPDEFLNPDGTIRENYDVYCGIDTGRSFAATFWLVDTKGNLWGFDEYYAEGLPTRENANELKAICRKWNIVPIYCLDSKSQHEVDLGDEGIHCTKTNLDVEVGLSLMVNYMAARPITEAEREAGITQTPMLRVVAPNFTRWLWERQRYQYEKPSLTGPSAGQAKNKPMKKDDHAQDSGRFVISLRPAASQLVKEEHDPTLVERIHEHVTNVVRERELNRDVEMQEDWN